MMMPMSPAEHSDLAGYIFHNYHHLLNHDEREALDVVLSRT